MKVLILLALVAATTASQWEQKWDTSPNWQWQWNNWACPLPRIGMTPECPAVSCKRIIDLSPFSKDGLYWFRIDGVVIQAWCDMTNGGFMTVAKFPKCFTPATRMSNSPNEFVTKPHTIWEVLDTVVDINEGKLEQLLKDPMLNVVYKNRAWRHWDWMNVQRVRISFWKNNRVAKTLEFDATGSDRWSWFSLDNLVTNELSLWNSWSDIRDTTAEKAWFSWRSLPNTPSHNEWLLMSELKTNVQRTCDQKKGWFWAVNTIKSQNRCSFWDTCRGIHFLFSKLDIHARFFVPQEIEVADAVTISWQ